VAPSEELDITVERMIRFCYLAEMTWEYSHIEASSSTLPLHLNRFGALFFETAGFLYSLFEDRNDSVNLLRSWRVFENPFMDELETIRSRLEPFKPELEKVRNRISFHGSRNRSHEKDGLDIFNIESGRGPEFASLVQKIQLTAKNMIEWYCMNVLQGSVGSEAWRSFEAELKGYSIARK